MRFNEDKPNMAFMFNSFPRNILFGNKILIHDHYSKEHVNRFHEIMLLRRGQVTLRVDNEGEWHAKAGDILLLRSNQLHADIFPRKSVVEMFLFHFNWDGACEEEFFRVVNNDRLRLLSKSAWLEIEQQFYALEANTAVRNNISLCASRLHLILMILYNDLLGEFRKKDVAAYKNNIVKMAGDYILAHLGENLSLDNISAFLKVSKFHLNRTFSNATGKTLHQYLLLMRIKRAQEFLNEGRMPLADIAVAVGFQDVNYFSRVFKKYCGYSPSAHFRKKTE